jgi:hypothetical protein
MSSSLRERLQSGRDVVKDREVSRHRGYCNCPVCAVQITAQSSAGEDFFTDLNTLSVTPDSV